MTCPSSPPCPHFLLQPKKNTFPLLWFLAIVGLDARVIVVVIMMMVVVIMDVAGIPLSPIPPFTLIWF